MLSNPRSKPRPVCMAALLEKKSKEEARASSLHRREELGPTPRTGNHPNAEEGGQVEQQMGPHRGHRWGRATVRDKVCHTASVPGASYHPRPPSLSRQQGPQPAIGFVQEENPLGFQKKNNNNNKASLYS
ncbi:hypothetical protein GOP47_0020447 [Adiantum capillus-veneris]|uniref:Uncharacterized protein n=1 Tax=Adiantum capillus-veneris TaxID=13818 RepID=A0A9D4UA00_ADICA|nr:hypothetical protein GOP47_0020447 [Adiantum capillus-veneris]